MTVKLVHASGNGTKISAPAANPSADITLKVPSTTGTAGQVLVVASANHSSTNAELEFSGSARRVLEQFFCPCDGSVIATSGGDITITDKDDAQTLTTSYADVIGSSITYTPPTGTTQVIYEYKFSGNRDGDDHPFGHFKFFIGSDEVTDARTTYGGAYTEAQYSFKWGINIGGSAVTATGRQASWSSGKVLKLQGRDYGSSNDFKLNQTYLWDGGASSQFQRPQIGITAIG